MAIDRTGRLSIDWSYSEQTNLKPNTVFLSCISKKYFCRKNLKYSIFVAKICKYGIFVVKICKYGIFVAKIYKYALNDSFLWFAGFLDSSADLAALARMTEKSTDDDNYVVNDNYDSNDGNFDDNDKKIPQKNIKILWLLSKNI